MDQFKEFQGKDLDECIKEACAYFNSPREKLEVEIIQDAKSGVFGIIGARKAKIRARRAHLREAVLDILNNGGKDAAPEPAPPRPEKPARKRPVEPKRPPRPQEKPEEAPSAREEPAEPGEYVAFENLDLTRLEQLALETVAALLKPIAGREVVAHVELGHGRARIKVDWEGDAGLLIGREGQTLAAIEYLAARILSRAMNSAVRVQLEIGDYKSRQDDRLRDIALSLAEKARKTGKSWSTHPLSSYHRRIVHMALQEEPGIVTRSSGDGPLKRVIIMPRRASEA